MTSSVVRWTTLRRRRSSATRRPEKTTPDKTEAIKEATRLALELEWDTWKLSAKSNTWKREPGPPALRAVRPPTRHITPDAWCDLVHAARARTSGTVEFTPNRVPDTIWIDYHEGKSSVIRQLLSHCEGFCRCKRSRLRGACDHLLAQS